MGKVMGGGKVGKSDGDYSWVDVNANSTLLQ